MTLRLKNAEIILQLKKKRKQKRIVEMPARQIKNYNLKREVTGIMSKRSHLLYDKNSA